MSIKQPLSVFFQGLAAFGVALLAGCGTTGGGTPTVAVAPMCTVHAVTFDASSEVEVALVSERTNPNVNHGFTRFRGIGGPQGNTAVGFTPDVYGISEAWSRAIATSSANRGDEQDDPVAGGLTVPQLMPVGLANPQVFGCAGRRSDDNAVRTTWLIDATVANAATGTGGGVTFIQDLLNGDDRFLPNAPGPLIGPATAPTPRITNRPGDPVREGSVTCAMTQFEDDVATRELHMLSIKNGVLHHSMANNFGPAATGSGAPFNRFRTVSTWGDVGQALGGGFGNIVAVTMVGQPHESELVYAMWTDEPDIRIGRIVSTPRQWAANIFGVHSQLFDLSALIGGNADPARRGTINSMVIGTRPFRDDARP